MNTSALEGKDWFGFDKSNFMEAVANPDAAYQAMAEEINKSTEEDPLFIIAAGPIHVLGKGFELANEANLEHVSIISQSNWNNR